ncbi:hypothetical protein M9H77_31461 [Catharanthus roseus]|uniref:Uncharacterized protein n=1 Tax=Catharanthus roseus TaxID=4058 RepID=A0ACC0A113_CATRO|nr:hypothetical protein M9H77_31461 [Catharanthus roseus]
MNFSIYSNPHSSHPSISCFYKKPTSKSPILKPAAAIPARDRIIDFGKYKGKMLGTLPSTYLKWVSKNLRARDFEEWAKLADEVLEDPVYVDRIEWEFAQKVLNGDVLSSYSSRTQNNDVVSDLLDISERFGWDNEDKLGWAKIDFGLLGTSKGGRIPRLSYSGPRPNKDAASAVRPKNRGLEREMVGDERRKERRERLKMRRKCLVGDDEDKLGTSFGISSDNRIEENDKVDEEMVKIRSPFPGRESLIKKVLNRRRY